MSTLSLRAAAFIASACWCGIAIAQPADLSNWTLSEYPLNIGGYANSDWRLYDAATGQPGGTTEVRQFNGAAVASIYLSDFVLNHAVSPGISGQLGNYTGGDDDQFGLVFGFQDLDHLYLFQWKRGGSVTCCESPASKGMHIRRIDVQPGGSITNDDIEGHFDTANSTILVENDTRWEEYVIYDFAITFLPTGFRFVISDGATVLADWTVNDTTYTTGKVGFYNTSQSGVRYVMDEVQSFPRVEVREVELGTSTGTIQSQVSGVTRGIYNEVTQSVTMNSGSLVLDYDIDSNPDNELFVHTLTDSVWDLQSGAVNVDAFSCSEGTLGAVQSRFLCANTDFGANLANESSADYASVPGTRIVGGDDVAIGPQLQADDYGLTQVSLSSSTLVAESLEWTASSGLSGYRLTFDVLVPAPQPVGMLLARIGTPDGVKDAAPVGEIVAAYDPVLGTVTMDAGSVSLPYLTGDPGDFSVFDHVLTNAFWDLGKGTISYSDFDCIEGASGAASNEFLCANTDFGADATNETTTDYLAEPATRVVGGDDTVVGPQRQGGDYAATQASWDSTTLVIESPEWIANPDGIGGATAGYQMLFVAGDPPSVAISAPTAGPYPADSMPTNLIATASDTEDGDLSDQVQWASDIDGVLSVPAQLSVGTHVITAHVSDSSGLKGSAAVSVSVINGPILSIDAPASGTEFVAGTPIMLDGTAMDVEDGDISASIQWTSELGGVLGAGSSLVVNLTAGAHLITATVADSSGNSPTKESSVLVIVQQDSDSDGLPDSWETTFGVSDPAGDGDGDSILNIDEFGGGTNPIDASPQVIIQSPGSSYSASLGEFVNFSAVANDPEDGDISANVRWSSNIDGDLGVGATLPTMLTLGAHTIIATVTDSAGGGPVIVATVQVGVNLPVVGDLDGDGDINISDLLLMQQLLMAP